MKRWTIRLRLTALYSGLFLATAVLLIVSTNALLRQNLRRQASGIAGVPGAADGELTPALGPYPPPPRASGKAQLQLARFSDAVLDYQWLASGVMLGVLAFVSIAVGWWLTGRVLRPLHRITETARRLSASNLHERIALSGPRDELSDLADTFDMMLTRLETAVNNQRRFIANAAHELRTPLAIERTAIEVGLSDPNREGLARVREDLLVINRRNERLINGLLLLAQTERGVETRESVALDDVVRETLDEMPPTEAVTVSHCIEPVLVRGDRVLLQRLAANLLQNAVRHNFPGGRVDVHVVAATGTLRVSNTGAPIPEDRIDEMFEPFRRLNARRAGTPDGDGAGLGLSIVASIARAHDATIIARPRPEGGLDMTVTFPLH